MVGIMTFIITGVNTFIGGGYAFNVAAWMRNWGSAYIVALPIMMI
ncbi:MAG: DUF2798 domain-containing protein, partial [Fibrobacterota bacterium]